MVMIKDHKHYITLILTLILFSIVNKKAVDEVFRISSGIPRLINRICEKALMYGCQQNLQILDDQDILYVSEHEMLQGGDGK